MPNDLIGVEDDDMFDPRYAAAVEEKERKAVEERTSEEERFLRRCKTAYARVFSGNASTADVQFVLHDLAWFCGAHTTQWRSDAREQDRVVARREVYQRIVEYLRLDYDTLAAMYLKAQN